MSEIPEIEKYYLGHAHYTPRQSGMCLPPLSVTADTEGTALVAKHLLVDFPGRSVAETASETVFPLFTHLPHSHFDRIRPANF